MFEKFFAEMADRRYFKAAMAYDKYMTHVGQDHIYTNAVLNVPGYSESDGAFRIFVQPARHVDMAGIKSNILLCVSSNDAYDDDLFFVCGVAFTRLPLADQLATIERELLRTDFAVKFDVRNPYDIWEACDMDDNAVADYVTGETRIAEGYIYVALSGAFGERIAKRVMRREHNLAINSAHIAGRFQEEQGRRINDLFNAARPNTKKAAKSGKAARKTIRPEMKTFKKANASDWKRRAKEWAEEIKATKASRKKADAETDDGFDIPEVPKAEPKKSQPKTESKAAEPKTAKTEQKKVIDFDDTKATGEKIAAEAAATAEKINASEAAAEAVEETPKEPVTDETQPEDAPTTTDAAEGTASTETE